MGNDLAKFEKESEDLNIKQYIESEDFVLTIPQRNFLRKKFLIGVTRAVCIFNVVYKNKKTENSSEMSRADELGIQVFDGSGYSMWRKRIVLLLKNKKCDAPATREKRQGEEQATWDETNDKALYIIWSGLSNNQLEFVQEETSALKALQKLDSIYTQQSSSQQVSVRNKLAKMKLKDFEESSDFFIEFEKSINDLKNAGVVMTEIEKLSYLLGTLPESMDHIADIVDALPEPSRTCEFVKNKILRKEESSKCDKTGKKSCAFKVENKKEGMCFKCGGIGHFQRECPSPGQRGSRGGPRRRGQQRGGARHCNEHGNQQQQQGQYHQAGGYQQRGRGSRGRGSGSGNNRGFGGSSSRGNNRGWSRYYGENNSGNMEHNARYSERQEDYPGSFLTQVEHVSCANKVIDNRGVNINKVSLNSEVNVCDASKIEWIIDSGCTDHIVNDDSYFNECAELSKPVEVKVGDGRILKGTKIGNIDTYFWVNNKRSLIKIPNIIYVRDMDRNLLSVAKITVNNEIVFHDGWAEMYDKNDKLIAVGENVKGLYKISSFVENSNMNGEANQITVKEKFHRMLGHVNFDSLNKMCINKMANGLPENLEDIFLKCGTCLSNKMHNLPFKNKRKRATELLGIVHTDVNGPQKFRGYDGSRYFVTFVDDLSRLAIVYTIKSKSEVYGCFVSYINKVENMINKKIKKFRCDNGKEYLNNKIYDLADEKGIEIEPCPPYVHELNGVAEKFNRDVMNSARCLMYEASVSKIYWPEIVRTACYLKNRTYSSSTYENRTPFEVFFGNKPDLNNLQLCGSKVYVRVPEVKRDSKWDRKADVGVLLGYENVGYRVLVNGKIFVARHVEVIEKERNLIGFKGVDDSDASSHSDTSSQDSGDNIFIDEPINENTYEKKKSPKRNEIVRRKSERERKQTDFYRASLARTEYVYVNFVNANSPRNYREMLECDDADLWQKEMDREMHDIKRNKTYELVDKPENRKILDLMWVYTNKSDGRKKARLVVLGCQQSEVLEDLYSPVAGMQTLKLLLNYCCQYGLKINQMDVVTAFLNGKVKSEVFVKQPQGYNDGSGKVWKLFKALYGLRESPRAWYECFDSYIKSIGFTRSKNDYCLYSILIEGEMIYLILFVDDLLICGKNEHEISKIKGKLSEKFAMKDLGEVKTYLGINVEYDCKKGEMSLDQTNYIESLAEKYEIRNAKLYYTPMEQSLSLEPAQSASNDLKYRNLIGALLYVSTGTRLDVAYSVNYLSRFQNCYDERHYKYALRILKYLYLTRDLKLKYKRNFKADLLDAFVDADWAGDKIDRKSTTGYIVRMFGNAIYWKSRKQGSVTKSSTAAEYVALSEVVSEIKVMINLLEDFQLSVDRPVKIFEDNTGAIAIANYGNMTKKSKYIEVHYHYVNEMIEKGVIKVTKIESEYNCADILTKSLGRNKFEFFRKVIKLIK